jgi:cytochrome b
VVDRDAGRGMATPAMVTVWPAPLRLAHWLLAGSVIGCLLLYRGGPVHEALGYVALAVAVLRVATGLVGVRADSPARFGRFVPGPRATWAYLRTLLAGREARHVGHNPLGAWMVVALLAVALTAGGSGALYVTDRYWGDERVLLLHAVGGWGLLVLLPLHIAGVVFTSMRQRENLVRAMIDGRKRAPGPDDVPA